MRSRARRLTALLLAAQVLFLFGVAGTETAEASQNDTALAGTYAFIGCGGIVQVDDLAVRTDTSITATIYWVIHRNDLLLVTGTTQDGCWYKILYQGHTGYVDSTCVKIIGTLNIGDNASNSGEEENFLAAGAASIRGSSKLLTGAVSSNETTANNSTYNLVSLCADTNGTAYTEDNVPEGTTPEDYSFPGGTPLTVVGVEGHWLKVQAKKGLGTVTGYLYSTSVLFTAIEGYEDYSDIEAADVSYYKDWADRIWAFFKEKGLSDKAVAGMMGSLYVESGFASYNLQNYYESRLGMSDADYTNAVDNGTYTKDQFITDSAGYGLSQWTSNGRKKELYEYARKTRRSIGDLTMQLEFIWREISGECQYDFSSVLFGLRHAQTVQDASDLVMTVYEGASFTTSYTKAKRLAISMRFYEDYSTEAAAAEDSGDGIENSGFAAEDFSFAPGRIGSSAAIGMGMSRLLCGKVRLVD